jgi:inhibitor of growth protein 5
MKKIDELATEYLEGIAYPTKGSSGSVKREELMSTIQQLFNKAKEYGDDKVQLAIQTYELVSTTSMTLFSLDLMLSSNSVASTVYLCVCLQVDKHIRRLDSDLARFEAEIQEKAAASSVRSVEETGGNKSKSMLIFCLLESRVQSFIYFP